MGIKQQMLNDDQFFRCESETTQGKFRKLYSRYVYVTGQAKGYPFYFNYGFLPAGDDSYIAGDKKTKWCAKMKMLKELKFSDYGSDCPAIPTGCVNTDTLSQCYNKLTTCDARFAFQKAFFEDDDLFPTELKKNIRSLGNKNTFIRDSGSNIKAPSFCDHIPNNLPNKLKQQ